MGVCWAPWEGDVLGSRGLWKSRDTGKSQSDRERTAVWTGPEGQGRGRRARDRAGTWEGPGPLPTHT